MSEGAYIDIGRCLGKCILLVRCTICNLELLLGNSNTCTPYLHSNIPYVNLHDVNKHFPIH